MKRKLSVFLSIAMLSMALAGCTPAANSASATAAPAATATAAAATPAPADSKTPEAAPSTAADGAVTLQDGTVINAPGVFPIVVADKPYELSLFMPVSSSMKIDGNLLLDHWQKKTNVKVNIIEASADAGQQLNLMLASGENLPDAISYGSLGMDRLSTYGAQGTFLALNELMDKWTVNVQPIWDYTQPAGKMSLTALDGNLYAVPSFESCFHCNYAQRGWMNQTWLDNLSLKMPTTTDEFYNVLKEFKEKDANKNGDPNDEIPFVAITDGWNSTPGHFLMNAFITYPVDSPYRMNVVNGKAVPYYTQPEYKEGIKFIKKLYAEGLLDKDAFVMTNAQASMLGTNAKGNQVGTFFSGVPTMLSSEGDMPKQYKAINPLKGPNGVQSTYYEADSPTAKFAITNKCKNPEVAMRWADSWLESTPEFYALTHGAVSGDKKDGYVTDGTEGLVGLDGKPATTYQNVSALWAENNILWLAAAQPYFAPNEIRASACTSLDPTAFDLEAVIYQAALGYEKFKPAESLPSKITFKDDKKAEVSELQTQITTFVDENFAAFVTGEKDIDKDWDKYLSELNSIGVDRIVEIVTEAWHTQYK